MGATKPEPMASVKINALAFCVASGLLLLLLQWESVSWTVGRARTERHELLSVSVVFRHGSRTPLSNLTFENTSWDVCPEVYPGVELDVCGQGVCGAGTLAPPIIDPDTPQLPGNCTQGTLTRGGYEEALRLGAALRARYVLDKPLLPLEQPPAGVLTAHTTSMRRTVATLRGVLTGLYPDAPAPFPVDAVEEPREYMYAKGTTCAALEATVARLSTEQEAETQADPEARKAAAKVAAALQLPPDAPVNWSALRDVLMAMEAAGLPTPRALTPALWKMIDWHATRHHMEIYAGSEGQCPPGMAEECRQVITLGVGPLMWRILEAMRAREVCEGAAEGGGEAPPPPPLRHRRRRGLLLHGWRALLAGGGEAATQAEEGEGEDGLQLEGGGDAGEEEQAPGRQGVESPVGETQPGEPRGGKQAQGDTGEQPDATGEAAAGAAAPGAVGDGGVVRIDGGAGLASAAAAVRTAAAAACGALPRVRLYSGHDTTLMPLLTMLRQHVHTWPPFAADMAFELWRAGRGGKGGGALRVRVLYNGRPLRLRRPEHGGRAGLLRGGGGGGGAGAEWLPLHEFEVLVQGWALNDQARWDTCWAGRAQPAP